MKISASYWMFEGGLEAKKPIAEAMQEAGNLGFDAIELCIASQGVLTHNTTQAECEDIVAAAQMPRRKLVLRFQALPVVKAGPAHPVQTTLTSERRLSTLPAKLCR
jgi:chorismate-pyruvate lyase